MHRVYTATAVFDNLAPPYLASHLPRHPPFVFYQSRSPFSYFCLSFIYALLISPVKDSGDASETTSNLVGVPPHRHRLLRKQLSTESKYRSSRLGRPTCFHGQQLIELFTAIGGAESWSQQPLVLGASRCPH